MQTEEDIGSCEAGVTGNCEKVDMGAGNGSTIVGKSKQELLVGIPSLHLSRCNPVDFLISCCISFCIFYTLKIYSKK